MKKTLALYVTLIGLLSIADINAQLVWTWTAINNRTNTLSTSQKIGAAYISRIMWNTPTNLAGETFDFYDSSTNSYLMGHAAFTNMTMTISNVVVTNMYPAGNPLNYGTNMAGDARGDAWYVTPLGTTNYYYFPSGQIVVTTTNVVAAGTTTARKIATLISITNSYSSVTFDPPLLVTHGIYMTNTAGAGVAAKPGGDISILYSPIRR